jgi:hypothetical protein
MEAAAMTKQFWQKTLMHYSPKDVDPEKVREGLSKLELIGRVALQKREIKLADDCQQMLTEAQQRWAMILKS